MAHRIAENVWQVQDTTLRMPVVIRDAAMAAAVSGRALCTVTVPKLTMELREHSATM